MKSSKTKVLNFDEHWNGCCISSNCEEDEARFHFEAGSQSKQAEVDELRKRLNMYEREGYKLVPVEPTKDMLNSGYRVKHDKIIDLGSVYKAMIGACDD